MVSFARFHADTATLRRELVGSGLVARHPWSIGGWKNNARQCSPRHRPIFFFIGLSYFLAEGVGYGKY